MNQISRTLLMAGLATSLTASASVGDGLSAAFALAGDDSSTAPVTATTDAGMPPSPVSTDISTTGSGTTTDTGSPTLLGLSSGSGDGSSPSGVSTTSPGPTTGTLDAHALLALDDQGWAQVSPTQLRAIADEDYRTLSQDDLIKLLERLHKMQADALGGLLAGDAIPADGDAGGSGPDDPATISALSGPQLESVMSMLKLSALDDLKFNGFTPVQRQTFATHLTDARDDLALKIQQGSTTDPGSDADADYEASWTTGRVNPNWKFMLEHTDYNPWGGTYPYGVTRQYKGQLWKSYLEDNMPQGLDDNAQWKWIGQQVGRLNDLQKISQIPESEMSPSMLNIKRTLDAKSKEPSFWKKAIDFLACSLAFSLFDYVAFNAWPRNKNGDVNWTYRAVQTTVQIGLTLHLLKHDGPMTAMAFNNNWATFGDDYMFYVYGVIGKWLNVVPANTTWDGVSGFQYFQQQPDGSYRKAPWTTWVLRDGAHGFDKNNPADIMNGPELLSNFTKGSWLTFHLLTMKDTPLKDTPFFQKFLSWVP